jgi:TctA family transporter
MGLFGVAEVLTNIEKKLSREVIASRIGSLLPTRADWRASAAPIGRGTVLGFMLGILPGVAPSLRRSHPMRWNGASRGTPIASARVR